MNYEIFQWINHFAGQSALLDQMMILITNSVPYITVAFMFLLWFNRNHNEQGIAKQYTAIYATFSALLALLVNALIHLVYYHPRPFATHHVHQLVPHSFDSSFVSDHATLVFAIAWTLWLRNDSMKYVAMIWAVVVSVSRIYVGVHYPLDVIGGALLSFGTSLLVIQFAAKMHPYIQWIFRMFNQLAKRIPILSKYNHVTLQK